MMVTNEIDEAGLRAAARASLIWLVTNTVATVQSSAYLGVLTEQELWGLLGSDLQEIVWTRRAISAIRKKIRLAAVAAVAAVRGTSR